MSSVDSVARGGVTLHVGQLKTGTTSLQRALFDRRSSLLSRGVVYAPARGHYHDREAYSLMGRDPVMLTRMSPAFVHRRQVKLADGPDFWGRFVESASVDGPRTVLSAESLSFVTPELASIAGRDLAAVPVRIVATTRPLSRLIISQYAQWAKKYALPAPETVIRLLLADFVARGHDSPKSWMLAGRLRSVWESTATDGYIEVAFDSSDIVSYQARFWEAVGVPGPPPAAIPHENESLSAGALLAWQERLHRQPVYDDRVDGGTMAWALGSGPHRGGPAPVLRLTAESARLVDDAFPVEVNDAMDADAARRALHLRLADHAPMVEYVIGGSEIAAPAAVQADTDVWRSRFATMHAVVAMRIRVARILGLRRDPSDWDRFAASAPGQHHGLLDDLVGDVVSGA